MVIQPDLTLLGGSPANREGQSDLDEDKTRLSPLLLLLPLGLGGVGVLESIGTDATNLKLNSQRKYDPRMHWCDKPWGLLSMKWIAGSPSAWTGF